VLVREPTMAASIALPAASPPPPPLSGEQAFQQLAQAYQQQQQQIQALHEQLQHLHAAAPHPGSASSSGASVGEHHSHSDHHSPLSKLLSKPSVFRGEHGNQVYDWIAELDILFENCGEEDLNDGRKISFAKQALRDEALRWWIARERDATHAANSHDAALMAATPIIHTWEEFKAAMTDYFAPRGSADAARSEIHQMKQQSFRNLAAYIDHFESVSRRIPVPPGHNIDDELIAAFKAGLLDKQIRLALTTAHPSSLYQATRLALQADSDLHVSGFSRYGERNNYNNYSRSAGRNYSYPPNYSRANREGPWHRQGIGGTHQENSSAHRGLRAAPFHLHGSGTTPMDVSVLRQGACSSFEEAKLPRENNSEDEYDEREAMVCWNEDAAWEEAGDEPDAAEDDRSASPPAGGSLSVADSQRRLPRSYPTGRPRDEKCWNCGQNGHMSRDCPRPRRDSKYESRSTISRPSSTYHSKNQQGK
jgi:hypothetical protein